MPILVPLPGNDVLAESFGAPVANEVNRLTDLTAPSAWTAMPFAANAANLSPNQPCQYRKVGDIVQLRGVFTFAIAVGQNTEVVFATLPAGFRPPANVIAFGLCGWVAEAMCRFNILTTGNLSFKPHIALTGGENFITLGGILSYSLTA